MDRRQKKTRNAIFEAFITLLSRKNYNDITVGEIIEKADVGRATFYAHFETKDFLLKALCQELFDHIFEASTNSENKHNHIFDCDAPDSVFLHLFMHIKNNDNNILELLSCPNNELFLFYFKENLASLIKENIHLFENRKADFLPKEFFIAQISATFTETVRWWIKNKLQESSETITKYFLAAV